MSTDDTGAAPPSQSRHSAPPRGRRTRLAAWAGDLRLGVRLAIGGGRTSKTGVVRLVLGTIGIGLAVAVLLVGASAGPMFAARAERVSALAPSLTPTRGVDPLYLRVGGTEFRGTPVIGAYLHASGPNSPRPPGVSRVPGDGEIVVSPALADLLCGPDGDLLRPRFPQRVVGLIEPRGVLDAGTLTFYAGDDRLGLDLAYTESVYGFGAGYGGNPMPANLAILIVFGSVVLLVPVFVFVGTSARIAGAERDRRLAALRLVGVSARQARRIAAAESLTGAVTGLALGVGLFLLFRMLVGRLPILGVRPYSTDVAPPWPLVVLILLLVPGLAVVTAMVALRRTIIEPLGVVRRSRPVRRRLAWRLVPVVAGPVLLLSQRDVSTGTTDWVVPVVAGATLLLFAIPALLPWVLERAVARVRGGRPAFQLAFRRLQLDSGTPARVVSGVAVVLAGAIALQAVLTAQASRYDLPGAARGDEPILMSIDNATPGGVLYQVRQISGLRSAIGAQEVTLATSNGDVRPAMIVDCDTLRTYAHRSECADGDVYRVAGAEHLDGQAVTFHGQGVNGVPRLGSKWTVPDRLVPVELTGPLAGFAGELLITPGAVRGLRTPGRADFAVWVDPSQPDVLEHLRNAVAPYGWHAQLVTRSSASRSDTARLFLTVQSGLFGGALFTLLLAGLSMLVLALEQVRERRRPLAVLAAVGVPTGTLARSLLWQNTIPVLLGLAVAVVTGMGLAGLVFRLTGEPFSMDFSSLPVFCGVAAALVLVVTALTLPSLRGATRLAALRSE